MERINAVPPEGSYGWVIVFAQALSNLVIIPLMQSFGLIFKDTFASIGLSATEGSLIININAAFGMLTGLLNGALLKFYGYRKVATLGGFTLTIGIILTAYSQTFTHFLLAYGIITSAGMGLCISACNLAVNTYFKAKRNRAISISMTVTGFGPILMPQIINYLMSIHPVQGVTLILGGISAHTLISAALLQPIKWHYKKIAITEVEHSTSAIVDVKSEKSKTGPENSTLLPCDAESALSESRKNSESNKNDPETDLIFNLNSAMGESIISLQSLDNNYSKPSTPNLRKKPHCTVKCRSSSLKQDQNSDRKNKVNTKQFKTQFIETMFRTLDLDLLKDPIYVNIMLGMSLAIFAEINFSVLTAFILADFGLATVEIASFLSILGATDIVFRFLAPFIGECLNKSARFMYTLTLFSLIMTRFLLLFFRDYYLLLMVAGCLGIAKGVRTVYMSLVIPDYVTLEKLPSASGIQMMVNGICMLIGGPLIGVVRDVTGSYSACIAIMNCVTFTTIIMWTIEALIVRFRK